VSYDGSESLSKLTVTTQVNTTYRATHLTSHSLPLASHVLLNPQQRHNPANVQTSLPCGKSASKIQMSQGILQQFKKNIQEHWNPHSHHRDNQEFRLLPVACGLWCRAIIHTSPNITNYMKQLRISFSRTLSTHTINIFLFSPLTYMLMDYIHHPVFSIDHDVSETGCLHPQVDVAE
jgi:hypothetical protein